MSARRFKGYRVRRADGTLAWHGVVASDVACQFIDDKTNGAAYLVPVFGKPKPAPAEGAAEGRYAVLVDQKGAPHFVNYGLDLTMHAGDRDTMEYERGRVVVGRGPRCAPVRLVRVLDDGALEAALEATRREERERVFFAAEVAIADVHGWDAAHEIMKAARDEAAKGQAK